MKSSRSDTTAEHRLIVFAPELEALLEEAHQPPAWLGRLLQRPARALDQDNPQAQLLLGQPVAPAALTRRLDCPEDAQGVWLRADPIDLKTDLAAVWLDPEQVFAPGAWQDGMTALLAEEGLEWQLINGRHGYLRLETLPQASFQPPWTLAGNSLEHCLPSGPDALRWRRLLTEVQVLLQQYRQQDASSADAIPGSLWFWGGGQLPMTHDFSLRANRVQAQDRMLEALVSWLGLEQVEGMPLARAQGNLLLEWRADFEREAEENLLHLQRDLRVAWKQLRRGRIRQLELGGMESLRCYTLRDAWWFRP